MSVKYVQIYWIFFWFCGRQELQGIRFDFVAFRLVLNVILEQWYFVVSEHTLFRACACLMHCVSYGALCCCCCCLLTFVSFLFSGYFFVGLLAAVQCEGWMLLLSHFCLRCIRCFRTRRGSVHGRGYICRDVDVFVRILAAPG